MKRFMAALIPAFSAGIAGLALFSAAAPASAASPRAVVRVSLDFICPTGGACFYHGVSLNGNVSFGSIPGDFPYNVEESMPEINGSHPGSMRNASSGDIWAEDAQEGFVICVPSGDRADLNHQYGSFIPETSGGPDNCSGTDPY
jgi:hypothetical protein